MDRSFIVMAYTEGRTCHTPLLHIQNSKQQIWEVSKKPILLLTMSLQEAPNRKMLSTLK